MSNRARMTNLASVLLSAEDRAEPAPVPARPEEQKTGNPKTSKKVFGKVAGRQISPKRRTKAGAPVTDIEVHRAYGDRGDFEKVTVTLPSDVRTMLLEESLRRKKERLADWPIAAIVREAIAAYLRPKQ